MTDTTTGAATTGAATTGVQVNRRAVLAAAAATGLVAACGGSGGTDSGNGSGGGAGPATTPGEAVATTADVPVGGGSINSQAQVVVTQPVAGDYRAFSSVCPHQGCQVSEVADNTITCRCHGSRFSAQTGDVEAGPARTGLAPVGITVEGDSIVVS